VELHRIAIRALFAFLALHALLRASGKRVIAHGTPFDFVLALLLGDMVDDLLWAEVSAARFSAAVGTLCVVHAIVGAASARSDLIERWVSGDDTCVLERGRPRPQGMRGERVNQRELAGMLREHGLDRARWSEVEAARLEVSGRASVLKAPWARPATGADRDHLPRRRPS
jgi:uncharacterized membrane protein YcaP (DUF421 family)